MKVSIRPMAGVAAALAAGLVAGALRAQPQPAAHAVTCTNPASGATWQIDIDYGKATVDARPARISDSEISWHDASNNGNYTLDRKSGELTIIMPSSTGG